LRRFVRVTALAGGGAANLVGLRGHHRVRQRRDHLPQQIRDAEARCCSNNAAGSKLCGAAIVVILSLSSLVGTHDDHAVVVSRHDATPLTSEELVHLLRQPAVKSAWGAVPGLLPVRSFLR
jgi:hypothetical protein